jgi:hypothetical protein
MKRIVVFALVALVAPCIPAQQTGEKQKTAPAAESRPADGGARRMGLAKPVVITAEREVYGAELAMKETTKLPDIMKDPKAFDGKRVRVTGTIGDVCQKKGCFMFLKEGDAKTQVKFKDYAFFVPFDVAGRTVVVEGTSQVKELSEAWRRHYAEDQGKSKEEIEKIKGSELVVMIVADAVEIRGGASAAESKPVEKKP